MTMAWSVHKRVLNDGVERFVFVRIRRDISTPFYDIANEGRMASGHEKLAVDYG